MLGTFLKGAKGGGIDFLSSSSGAVSIGTSSVSAIKPAGTQDGDLLLAFARAGVSLAVITPDDTGWTQELASSGTAPSFVIFSRNANSDPASYSFTRNVTSGTFDVVVCLFRGGSNSVDTVGSLNNENSASVTATSLTTNRSGLLVARFSWNLDPIISSAPSGMLVADTSLDDDGIAGTTVVYYESISKGETSGDKVLTLSSGSLWAASQISIF